MQALTIEACAKINLYLKITGRRPDGYHLLESLMQSVTLSDIVDVSIDKSSSGIFLEADQKNIPLDQKNTCFRAAEKWLEASGEKMLVRIKLQKRIPSEAGLGGASADAAAVLKALNQMSDNPLSAIQLNNIAAETGADVPFCLNGGLAFCEGIGEKITALEPLEQKPLIIIKPSFGLSTPAVFSYIDANKSCLNERKNISGNMKTIATAKQKKWSDLSNYARNEMQFAATQMKPELEYYIRLLESEDSLLALMSGSGTSIFAIYQSEEARDKMHERLCCQIKPGDNIYKALTSNYGLNVIGRRARCL